ncbi:MAG: SMI1/KNR4 family protein [Tannerella sp.]|jgi:hypothetical protein|nr:SMI1/KNR4 family protein [Tannerella sp.]
MTPLEKLKSIVEKEYESEDGDLYEVELLDGMSDEEIADFKQQLPNQYMPSEIEELLKYTRGFEFDGLEEVRFDTFGYFGFEELLPYSIELAGDGFGNFWVLDIDSGGQWNSVYYVCHAPAVVVKHSENLAEFIEHVDEFGEKGSASNLDQIHEETVMNIWQDKNEMPEDEEKDYDLSAIHHELPEMFMIADLTNKPIKTGFAWGKSGPKAKIIRLSDQPIWIVEKKEKQGVLSRLFGRK